MILHPQIIGSLGLCLLQQRPRGREQIAHRSLCTRHRLQLPGNYCEQLIRRLQRLALPRRHKPLLLIRIHPKSAQPAGQ